LDLCQDYVVPKVTNFSRKLYEFKYDVTKRKYQIEEQNESCYTVITFWRGRWFLLLSSLDRTVFPYLTRQNYLKTVLEREDNNMLST
jgi:hypothetical protein